MPEAFILFTLIFVIFINLIKIYHHAIEVLSDSTEGIDRVEKWRCYRKIDSLRQYLLIAQDKIFIDKYDRMKNTDKWENSYYDHPDHAIQIAGFDIKIKDIYHRISSEEEKEQ